MVSSDDLIAHGLDQLAETAPFLAHAKEIPVALERGSCHLIVGCFGLFGTGYA